VKRTLLRSAAFIRAAKRAAKKSPRMEEEIGAALELLAADAFHPRLRTHKLKGSFEGYWACGAGYDLRITFRFAQYRGAEAILLETVGTHEEVY
jgi:mRNA-degrading endonuclease YafQ of YafQ-DinJ toxin-antitoxin module